MELPHKIHDATLIRELDRDGITINYHAIMDSPAGQHAQVRRVLPHVTPNAEESASIQRRIADLSHISHPFLQRVNQLTLDQEVVYIIEGHREGLSLHQVLQWCRAKNVVLPVNIYLFLLVQICTALEALHTTRAVETKGQHLLHRALPQRRLPHARREDTPRELWTCGLSAKPAACHRHTV